VYICVILLFSELPITPFNVSTFRSFYNNAIMLQKGYPWKPNALRILQTCVAYMV